MNKEEKKSLDELNTKELLINIRLNVEKCRKEARSALSQIKAKSSEVDDLLLAIDRIHSSFSGKIATLEDQVDTLMKAVIELNTPWYKKLWDKINGRGPKESTS